MATPTKANRSPRSYKDRTLKLLWGKAAGRCAMPDCRIELFVDDSDYDPITVIGDIAHVAGSSDRGPRARADLSGSDRDSYKNLILLCKNCHGRIDGQRSSFPEVRILEIKAAHEAWVLTSLPERGRGKRPWTPVSLQGKFTVDLATAESAIAPDPFSSTLQILRINEDTMNWADISGTLRDAAASLMRCGQDDEMFRIALYPLAPVSACISFGYHLTNRVRTQAFQYHRDEGTWVWPKDESAEGSSFSLVSRNMLDATDIVFGFSLSAPIGMSETLTGLLKKSAFFEFTTAKPSTSWLTAKWQLVELGRNARTAFEIAADLFKNARQWHIFFAGPAPGATVIGQQLNPTMTPSVQLYEYRHPNHVPSILL